MKVNSSGKEEQKNPMNELSPNLNRIVKEKKLNELTAQDIMIY